MPRRRRRPAARRPASPAAARISSGSAASTTASTASSAAGPRAISSPRRFQAAMRTMSRGLLRSPRTADASNPECMAQLAQRRPGATPSRPSRSSSQNSFQSAMYALADQVAGRLPALGRVGHRAPGRAVVVALAGRELQVHRRRDQRVASSTAPARARTCGGSPAASGRCSRSPTRSDSRARPACRRCPGRSPARTAPRSPRPRSP